MSSATRPGGAPATDQLFTQRHPLVSLVAILVMAAVLAGAGLGLIGARLVTALGSAAAHDEVRVSASTHVESTHTNLEGPQ